MLTARVIAEVKPDIVTFIKAEHNSTLQQIGRTEENPLVCFLRHGATYEACDSDKVSCEPGVPEFWDPAGAYHALYLV